MTVVIKPRHSQRGLRDTEKPSPPERFRTPEQRAPLSAVPVTEYRPHGQRCAIRLRGFLNTDALMRSRFQAPPVKPKLACCKSSGQNRPAMGEAVPEKKPAPPVFCPALGPAFKTPLILWKPAKPSLHPDYGANPKPFLLPCLPAQREFVWLGMPEIASAHLCDHSSGPSGAGSPCSASCANRKS